MAEEPHKIVIVGGGAGGLELATKLGRKFGPEHIVLVDRGAYHIWKPSLHEVAAGTLDIYREGLSYFLLAKDHGFTFMVGNMSQLDLASKYITLDAVSSGDEQIFPMRKVSYDTLIMAVGSKSNFFNTPGAAEYSIALDSTEQAEHFRQKLLHGLARVDREKVDNPQAALNIAIVGGGATGVELAAELREACTGLAFYGLNKLDSVNDVKIGLFEGAPRILSGLTEKMSSAAQRLLIDRGVAVKTSVKIVSVSAHGLTDDQGVQHPADLCVWAAGIQAPAFLSQLGLATNTHSQIVADTGLCTSDPSVYAMGDCAQVPVGGKDEFLPARAQVAHQQADFLLGIMAARIEGRDPGHRVFKFRDYGSLVSIGHNRGVGSLMGVLSGKDWFVQGLFARIMYMSLHLMHHMAVLGFTRTAFIAIGRLFLKRSTPRVKLH